MKNTLYRASLVLGVIAATSFAVSAAPEDGKGKGPRGERRGPSPEMIKQYDKDGDGKLNEEEGKAAREAMRAKWEERRKEMMKEIDTDGNGEVSDEERQAFRDKMKAKYEAAVKKHDKDGDGKLDADERKAAIEAGDLPKRRPGGMRRPGGRQGGPGKGGKGGERRGKGGKGGQEG